MTDFNLQPSTFNLLTALAWGCVTVPWVLACCYIAAEPLPPVPSGRDSCRERLGDDGQQDQLLRAIRSHENYSLLTGLVLGVILTTLAFCFFS